FTMRRYMMAGSSSTLLFLQAQKAIISNVIEYRTIGLIVFFIIDVIGYVAKVQKNDQIRCFFLPYQIIRFFFASAMASVLECTCSFLYMFSICRRTVEGETHRFSAMDV